MGTCIEKQRKGNNNRANVAFNFQRQIVLAQRHGQVKVLIERTRGAWEERIEREQPEQAKCTQEYFRNRKHWLAEKHGDSVF